MQEAIDILMTCEFVQVDGKDYVAVDELYDRLDKERH